MFTNGRSSILKKTIEQSYPNGKFSRELGKRCQPLFEEDIIDFATTRYGKREDKIIFQINPKFMVLPKFEKNKLRFHFKKIKIL